MKVPNQPRIYSAFTEQQPTSLRYTAYDSAFFYYFEEFLKEKLRQMASEAADKS